MKTLITTLLGCLLYFNTIAQNAATSVWTDAFGLQDTVLKIPTVIDNLGNLYVAGSSINGSSGPDIVIKKYDSNGDPVFGLTYSSAGNNRDQATTIAIDNNFNLIVGGFSYVNATNSYDFLVLKYDSAGTLLWTYTYNGTGSAADLVSAMALDGSNIYITGASVGISSLFDFTTIKLNSAGSMQWNNRYNYLGADLPFDIDIIDTNIYVNGGSQSTITNWDYALLHYSINGAPIDTIRTTGTGVGFDRATQAVTDNQGYIYITGTYATTSNGLDYKTIKFDQQGNVKWIATFDNTAHQDDIANAIAVDFDGNVYITGKTFNSLGNYDYCTIKYDSLGTTQWTRFYDNKYYDEATSITVDSYNNVYVTGSSSNTANKDFTTIGYGTAGDTLWTKRFNGAYNGNDEATSIIEENGFVYVSGQTQINSTQYKNVTIAYGQAKIKEIPDLFGEEVSPNLFYIPNDGQLANDTGAIASNIVFYVPSHNPALFVNHHGLSYVFSKLNNDTSSNDTIHRIDMQFMKGNYPAKAVVYPNKITSDYFNNYYLPHCSNGVIDVRGSNMLFAKGLYEGIDLYYSSNLGGEKHYIVLAPNANPKAIKIKFNGADSVSTPLGKYSIHSSIGSMEYDSLVAYEIDALGNIIVGTTQPMLLMLDTVSNSYYFKTISYNTSNTLVIMAKQKLPQAAIQSTGLCWSTYFGGAGYDDIYVVDTDSIGNAYTGGVTGSLDFPNTLGQFFGTYATNMVTTKFKSNHDIAWSTFYSGSNNQAVFDLKVKSTGDIYTTGYTRSGLFYALQDSNAYFDDVIDGIRDAFVTRFNSSGQITWATLFGGTGDDYGHALAFDQNNNLLLVGKSQGGAFPLRTFGSAYYQTYGGGIDGFFARFNQYDSLIHCTFIGGNGEEHVSSVVVDGNNNVLLCGNTFSTNFPCVSPTNAYTDSIRGGTFDDFICKLSPLGDLVWSAYIGGSGDEFLYGIQTGSRIALDTANNIYLVGTTHSNDFPLYNSTGFNDHTFSSVDGYIMKFAAANMDTLWSSYFSESGKTELISIAIDSKNWKYIGGGTNDVSLVTITQNSAYNQNSIIGITDIYPEADAFLMVINSNEDIIYSTYFGGKTSQTYIYDNELIYDLNVSGDQLYFVGRTNSDDSTITFPTYDPGNGAYYEPYFKGGTSDAFISTICIDLIDGINEVTGENASNNILVYPNPANNTLNIKLAVDEKLESLELVNVSGEIIKHISKSNNTNRSFSVNIENIPNGIYLVKVNFVDKIISSKFIKQ